MTNHHTRPPQQHELPNVFQRIPLEDMRELWYWGIWKEPVPFGFSTSVVVVCTSRQKCRRYADIQTHDDWLADEDDDTQQLASTQVERDLFDESDASKGYGNRRFRLISFETLVDKLREAITRAGVHRLTLLVNPFTGSETGFCADGMYQVDEFLRACGLDDSPISQD